LVYSSLYWFIFSYAFKGLLRRLGLVPMEFMNEKALHYSEARRLSMVGNDMGGVHVSLFSCRSFIYSVIAS